MICVFWWCILYACVCGTRADFDVYDTCDIFLLVFFFWQFLSMLRKAQGRGEIAEGITPRHLYFCGTFFFFVMHGTAVFSNSNHIYMND